MACIHYKFKNSLDFDSITFDGLHISVRDLKESIMQRKKLNDSDMDLLIINALNAKAYKDEEEMIPKNASVIVARIPLADAPKSKGPKTLNAYKEDPKPQPQGQMPDPNFHKGNLSEAADLVTAKGSEEDKIKAMMKQSTKDFDPANYQKKYPTGTPSPSYVCFKCNKTGHFIHNCPNAAVTTEASGSPKTGEIIIDTKRIKRPTGIPYTFLTTSARSEPGAMLLGDGSYAVPTIDQQAFKKGKKERPPFLPAPVEIKKEEVAVPTELTCLLCKDLVTDAVVIPCCGNSYCDECIRNHLIEDEDHKCPTCHEENVSPDKLIINKSLRTSVNNFKNETLYQKQEKKSSPPPPPPPPPKKTSSTGIGSPLKLDTSAKPIDLTAEEPETPLLDENDTSEDVPKGIAVLSGGQAITTDTDTDETKTTPAITSAPSTYRPTESKSVESYTPQAPIPSLGTTGYRPPGPRVSLPNTALPPPGYRPPLLYPPSLVPPPFSLPPRFIPPQVSKPLSEHEFYRTKQRLLGKPNPLDAYTRPLDKEPKKRSRSKSPRKIKTRSRSRSRTPKDGPRKKSYSRTPPPKKRSYTKSRSRSPFRKSYTRSRSRSPRPRSRSRLRSRSITPRPRSRSWTPKKFRGRSRSYTRSRTRSPRYRKSYSRSPPLRRRSYSRSLTPLRRPYSRSPPPRRRSKSPYYRGRARSPGYSGYGGRDWSPPPLRSYRSPPPRGFSPGRYGSGPPPYNYGGHNDDFTARFDKRIYEEIFQDYLARFGLPPPPPPPAQQLERGMYYDQRKGVYRKRSRSRSPRSKRSDKNKDRKDDKDRKDEKSSRSKDKKTSDKSKSKTKKDDEKTKRGDEKTRGKEEKATKDKENKTKKPDEKGEGKMEKQKETEQKPVEKKVVKKVTKVKSKEEGTVVKKESIALRLKTKAGAGKSPVKLGKPKVLKKETESSNAALQAINRTGALKTIATTDNISALAPKENVYAMRKNSNLLEINTRLVLPEFKGTEKPKVSEKTVKEDGVSNTVEKEAKVLNKVAKEAEAEPMETEEQDEKKDSVSLKSKEKVDKQEDVKDDSKVVKKELAATAGGPSPPSKKVKVTKKVKKVKKLLDVDASQSDSASDMDKARMRKKKRVSEINEKEDESPAKRLKADSADEKEADKTDNKAKDEDQLMLSPPELSKWERDDYNEEKSPDLREKLKKKVEKKPLPRSVIESAEKAITQKQPKPATVASAIVPAQPQKKISVHDRLQKSPVRQTDSNLQKSPIKNDLGKKSPVQQKRRVYMDGDKQNQKMREEEENRRVRSRESSMQITISSDKKRGEKDNEVGKRYKNETTQRRVSESEKSDRHKVSVGEKSDKLTEKSEKRKLSVDEKSDKLSRHKVLEKDRSPEKDREKKEKVKSKSVENGNKEVKEKKERRSGEKMKTEEKESIANDDEKSSEKNVPNGQKEDNSKPNDENEKQAIKKKKYERKESIVDESAFVPDYNEHTDSDGESDGEASSASHVDEDDKKSDKEKDEKKHKKHKKEKKNKKNKKHKHKHKKKKHKKHKEEKETSEKGE